MPTWVNRWRYWVSDKPIRPNIYRLKTGGYLVRVGNTTRALRNGSLVEAISVRDGLLAIQDEPSLPLFSSFAVSIFEEKINSGELASQATRERWKESLEHYLIPAFGHLRVDQLSNGTIAEWKALLAKWIKNGKPSLKKPGKMVSFAPSTANGHLRILRTLCRIMTVRHRLDVDPYEGTAFFREPPAYSMEEPNSLTPDLLRQWLTLAKEKYPQHYMIMKLGFITGRRPGELRALQRADILWERDMIVIRHASSRGQERKGTKTGAIVPISLPQDVMRELKEHLESLPAGPMRDSDLVFPSTTGGVRSRSGLDKPFAKLCKLLKIKFRVTPRAMRRSFQDLARAAAIEGVVTRSISGHKTERMQEHYSTVQTEEQRDGLRKIVEMVT